jgi:sec-independent protein translocase protein TatB
MFPEGRIFDFAIIGVLALIVVGPKDLPVLMRKLGRFLAHMRAMAAEFRASFDEMARQSELDELRREVEALRTGQNLQTAVGLGKESGVHEVFDDISTGLHGGDLPSSSATPVPPADGAATPAAAAEAAEPPATQNDPAVTAAEEPGVSPPADTTTHPARAAL